MCGITGFITRESGILRRADEVARGMASAIAHRGPDDAGTWSDTAAGVAFGHRRLAIVDLSPAGHQPMRARGGRYVLAFNGEIYNHLELRSALESVVGPLSWVGHSDTETLLACFEQWGIEATLTRTVGMFAMAVWDGQQRMLSLARDRFGEKPLYYGWSRAAFVFGSELKAVRAFPGFDNRVSREALMQYLRFMYVPAPRSIHEGIFKLEPGCLLRVAGDAALRPRAHPLQAGDSADGVAIRRWWSAAESMAAAAANPIQDAQLAQEMLEQRITEAVRLQSVADVPLGAFLSGGVDSSTIAALMQRQSSRRIRTFTIGFDEQGFDEAPYARAVADHLGTDHTEFRVTPAEALDVIARLPQMYDEPFADSSQIPTHLVCHAARKHVTVALSGDAGDELFGGYNRYFWAPSIWKKVAWVPYPLRSGLGRALTAVPTHAWDSAGGAVNRIRRGSLGVQRLGDKAHKLAARLRSVRNVDDLYLSLVSEWQNPASLLQDGTGSPWSEPASLLAGPLPSAGANEEQGRMMYWDTVTYLPDDILCKVDRAAMSVSLETRVPLLDHRVAELAWQLPLSMKIRGMQGKLALRQVLYRHVPRGLIERPKAGFAIPVGQWLRGPLRSWAEALLGEDRLAREGYFRPGPIRAAWQEHLHGARDWTYRLWNILMFQAWLEANP